MTKHFVGVALLLVIAAPCRATSYRPVSLAELVGRSDVIVVATVRSVQAFEIRIKVVSCLAGEVKRHLTIPVDRLVIQNPGALRRGDNKIFFLQYREQELHLFYDFAFKPEGKLDEVRRLIDMRVNPKKYLADAEHNTSPEYLELLGFVFANRQRIGELDRADVIRHLEGQLRSLDPRTILFALGALKRVGSKQSASAVIPLLRFIEPEFPRIDSREIVTAANVRVAAAEFLGWTGGRSAVKPLCEALDACEDKELAIQPSAALHRIGDSAAIPALVRAVERGVEYNAPTALGYLGDESHFQLLFDIVNRDHFPEALGAMTTLVKRSNKKYEPWMSLNRGQRSRDTPWQIEWHRDDWHRWWAANKADFKVIKSSDEAFGPLEFESADEPVGSVEWPAEPSVEENESPERGRMLTVYLVLAAFLVVAVLVVLERFRRRTNSTRPTD